MRAGRTGERADEAQAFRGAGEETMTDKHYVRPYVPGSITTPGFIVVCVPGEKPVEVTEGLAERLTKLIVAKRITEARTLLSWFGGTDAQR